MKIALVVARLRWHRDVEEEAGSGRRRTPYGTARGHPRLMKVVELWPRSYTLRGALGGSSAWRRARRRAAASKPRGRAGPGNFLTIDRSKDRYSDFLTESAVSRATGSAGKVGGIDRRLLVFWSLAGVVRHIGPLVALARGFAPASPASPQARPRDLTWVTVASRSRVTWNRAVWP